MKHLLAFALTLSLAQTASAQFLGLPTFNRGGAPVMTGTDPAITNAPPANEPPPSNVPPPNKSSGTGLGAQGAGDAFYPWDAPEPWVHGHFQEIPAYGGYHYFKPYNYRHVMPQSQVGAGWGMPATMPYSQGFFRQREYAVQENQRYVQELARMQFLLEQERLRNQQWQQGQAPRGGYEGAGAEVPPGAINTISGRR